MRVEEASKANLKRIQSEITRKGSFQILEGNKGGRVCFREIKATNNIREAVAYAISVRPANSRNLIAPNEQYKDFKSLLNNAREIMKEHGLSTFHDCRAAFACNRYKEITGQEAPCISKHPIDDKALDKQAREQIAMELGHSRIEITDAYLGK